MTNQPKQRDQAERERLGKMNTMKKKSTQEILYAQANSVDMTYKLIHRFKAME